jgi:phage shock protein PspC (stress-responsive transcriptional regulator)
MKKLQRFPKSGYIGGVCHGLGLHTGLAPIIWRIIALITPSVLVYVVLWIFLKRGLDE